MGKPPTPRGALDGSGACDVSVDPGIDESSREYGCDVLSSDVELKGCPRGNSDPVFMVLALVGGGL